MGNIKLDIIEVSVASGHGRGVSLAEDSIQ
jgi:hypothetical protein